MNPLVESVLADPTSATGKAAYQRLKDLGFSHDADGAAPATTTPTAKPAASADVTPAAGADPASAVVETTVKAAVKSAAAKPATKPAAKLVSKPVAHPISIAARRRVH